MPKGRPTPKPVRTPKATTRVAAAQKPAAQTTKVALRAPNTRATNPVITKAINARKSIRTK